MMKMKTENQLVTKNKHLRMMATESVKRRTPKKRKEMMMMMARK